MVAIWGKKDDKREEHVSFRPTFYCGERSNRATLAVYGWRRKPGSAFRLDNIE